MRKLRLAFSYIGFILMMLGFAGIESETPYPMIMGFVGLVILFVSAKREYPQ